MGIHAWLVGFGCVKKDSKDGSKRRILYVLMLGRLEAGFMDKLTFCCRVGALWRCYWKETARVLLLIAFLY